MRNTAFAELPALLEIIQQEISKNQPRQAFVTHTKEGKVRVRFGEDPPGYTWYPMAISGTRVGEQVILLPTPNNGYVALPIEEGYNGLVMGYATSVAATIKYAIALGRAVQVLGSSERGIAIGDYAIVNGSPGGIVLGWNSSITSSQTATSLGYNADIEGSHDAMALGSDTKVNTGSPRSTAFGKNAVVPASTPDTTVISAKNLEVKPSALASTQASILTLHDDAGNPVVIKVNDGLMEVDGVPIGATAVGSGQVSSLESTTSIASAYADATVLYTGTLADLIPEAVSGTWDVLVTVSATVYRSVSTGGVRLFVGNGSESAGALGRVFPQNAGYGLVVAKRFSGMTPTSTIDIRLAGFSTAGTTHLLSRATSVVAVRKG